MSGPSDPDRDDSTNREQESRIDRLQEHLHKRAVELGTSSLTDDEIAEAIKRLRQRRPG